MPKPTPRVLALQKQFFDQYKKNKNSWVKKYGADAEKIMTGAAFKRAESAAMKENKQRIKEMVKKALMGPIKEEETVDPVDIATLDIPLLIRIMEYAREDANTDLDLHDVAEKLIALSKDHDYLCMDNYNEIVGGAEHDNVSEDSASIKGKIAKYTAKIKELRDTIRELDARDVAGNRVGHEIFSDKQYRTCYISCCKFS